MIWKRLALFDLQAPPTQLRASNNILCNIITLRYCELHAHEPVPSEWKTILAAILTTWEASSFEQNRTYF